MKDSESLNIVVEPFIGDLAKQVHHALSEYTVELADIFMNSDNLVFCFLSDVVFLKCFLLFMGPELLRVWANELICDGVLEHAWFQPGIIHPIDTFIIES